jgi:PAS domain S-box-containing protein
MNESMVFWFIAGATPTRLPCAALGDAVGWSFAAFTGRELFGVGLLAAAGVAAVVGWIGQWRSRRAWERRATELAAAEGRLRHIIDGATDGIILTDGETGIILQANRAVAELLGVSESELVGRHHTSCYPPERQEEMERRFRERMQRGGIGVAEVWPRRGTGESIPVELHARPLEIDGRRYMQATVFDLRKEHIAQAALRESEARFRTLFENVPVAVMEKDYTRVVGWLETLRAEGVADLRGYLQNHADVLTAQFARGPVTAANRTALQRLGLPDVAAYNRVMVDRIPPQVLRGFQYELEALWEGRTTMTCALDYPRSEGRMGHSLMHWSVPLLDGRPDRRRALLVFTDLTELRAAEERLRASEEQSRLALRGFNIGIWEYNFATNESFFSERWKQMLGYGAHEIGGRRDEWLTRVHPEDHAAVTAALEAHLHGKTAYYETEHRLRAKDNRYIWVHSRGEAVFDEQGQPVRIVGAHSDISERKQAEEARRASEERLRQIVQQADCMLWQARVTESAGRFEWKFHVPASGLHRRIFGHEYWGETELYRPEQVPARPEMDARCAAALRNGAPGYQQEFQVFADGREFWLAEKVEITAVGPGEWSLVGVDVDVTARRQAEEALRASEARYRELVEHSPLAIADFDIRTIMAWLEQLRATGITDLAAYVQDHPDEYRAQLQTSVVSGVNREAVRLLRAPSKEHLLVQAAATFTAETLKMRWQTLLAVWQGRSETEGETTFRAFDGEEVRTFYHWWVPTLDDRPDYARSQLLLVDLSDIKRAEDALATERERLSVTLRAMTEGVITVDLEGTVQFINEAAEKLTGWSAGAAVGRRIEEVCALRHEKTRAVVALPATAELAAARGADLPPQSVLISREAGLVLVEGRIAAMHGAGGAQVGAVLVLRDITERARLEAEVLRSSKLESLGILAGGIAHDFNNLLTIVMGNLTLAMLDAQVAAAAGRWLREAERGVLRARDLTQQLLTFAKGGDPVRTAVALPDIVREAAEFTLHGSKVRCVFDIAADLWPADVDKGQIGQVVQNIVINAVQAMPEGGALHIALRNATVAAGDLPALAAGRYLKLSLADTGTGIRSEHLTRIFDPYFTTKQQGSGLGLATVYSVVKKHQGHIEVESELGRGTTFRIWLPAAQRLPAVTAPVCPRLSHRTGRILFMDDEEPICRLATALLERMGYEANVVGDGSEVVREYGAARTAGRPYDAVILDLTVPGGMGGLEAMEALRKLDPEVRAIVSSGYSSDPVLANYRAHGFLGMVPKPYKINDLATTIQTVLGNGKA